MCNFSVVRGGQGAIVRVLGGGWGWIFEDVSRGLCLTRRGVRGDRKFRWKNRYPAMMPVQQSGCERGDGGGFGDRGVDGVVGVNFFNKIIYLIFVII